MSDIAKLLKRLETLRLMKRLTQTEMAKLLNVDFATYNRWVNGKRPPGKMNAFQIEEFLKKHKRT